MPYKTPFTSRQLSRIIILWGQHQSLTKVRREFVKDFNLTKHPRRVPKLSAFQRAINRFNETASAKPSSGGGSEKSVRTPQNILRVKDVIDNDFTFSVSTLPCTQRLLALVCLSPGDQEGEASQPGGAERSGQRLL